MRNLIKNTVFILLVLCLPSWALCVTAELVASFDIDDHIVDIEYEGSLAVVATKSGTILFYDLEDIAQPRLINEYASGAPVSAMATSSPFLFVATHDQTLSLFYIANPEDPQPLATLDVPGPISDLHFHEDLLFAAAHYQGLYILSVADPGNPMVVAHFTLDAPAYRLFLNQGKLFVACGFQGIKIVDVHTPSSPQLLGNYQTTGFCSGIRVDAHLGFIAKGTQGYEIIDVSDPAQPTSLYTDITEPVFWMSQYERHALLFGNVLRFVDRSDPLHPELGGLFDAFKNIYAARLKDNYLIVSFRNKGWEILKIADSPAPLPVSILNTGRYLYHLDAAPGIVYAANGPDGFQVIDVSAPAQPRLVATYSDHHAWRVEAGDGTLFTTDKNGGLLEFEVTNPALPLLKNRYWGHSGNALNVQLKDDQLFLAAGFYGLKIVDRYDLLPISMADREPLNAGARDVVIYQDFAYLIDEYTGLLSYDISHPAYPVAVNYLEIFRPLKGRVFKDHLYLACGEHGIFIFDLQDPSLPVLEGTCRTYFAKDVVPLNEKLALVADGNGGLVILDITDKTRPRINARYRFFIYESLETIATQGNWAFLGYGNAGLVTISLEQLLPPASAKPHLWLLYE